MLIISAAKTLAHVRQAHHDPALASILNRYRDVMEEQNLAILFIVQPGDRVGHLNQYRQRAFEDWEYIDHADGWYEAVFIVSDDGFGHVVLVPDQPGVDPNIISLCQAHAAEAVSKDDIKL